MCETWLKSRVRHNFASAHVCVCVTWLVRVWDVAQSVAKWCSAFKMHSRVAATRECILFVMHHKGAALCRNRLHVKSSRAVTCDPWRTHMWDMPQSIRETWFCLITWRNSNEDDPQSCHVPHTNNCMWDTNVHTHNMTQFKWRRPSILERDRILPDDSIQIETWLNPEVRRDLAHMGWLWLVGSIKL